MVIPERETGSPSHHEPLALNAVMHSPTTYVARDMQLSKYLQMIVAIARLN
jgi:hypothetical protein